MHIKSRQKLYNPANQEERELDGTGPDIENLSPYRHTFICMNRAETYHINDTWDKNQAADPHHRWIGITTFYKKGVSGHKESTNLTTAQTDATQDYHGEQPQALPHEIKVDRSKPYDGPLPPQPLDPSIDRKIFVQDPITKMGKN